MIWVLTFTQVCTLLWVFWLDHELKAVNKYVQGLNGADHMMRDEPGRFA